MVNRPCIGSQARPLEQSAMENDPRHGFSGLKCTGIVVGCAWLGGTCGAYLGDWLGEPNSEFGQFPTIMGGMLYGFLLGCAIGVTFCAFWWFDSRDR
jgi:hypothetical protein